MIFSCGKRSIVLGRGDRNVFPHEQRVGEDKNITLPTCSIVAQKDQPAKRTQQLTKQFYILRDNVVVPSHDLCGALMKHTVLGRVERDDLQPLLTGNRPKVMTSEMKGSTSHPGSITFSLSKLFMLPKNQKHGSWFSLPFTSSLLSPTEIAGLCKTNTHKAAMKADALG